MDLRAILRAENFDELRLREAIVAAMDLKPERHYFYEKDHAQPVRLMNMTGG
jgi:cyclic pyranopterin phosphate synthase